MTLEFCELFELFRMNVTNQSDNVDLFFKFDTCTLQVLEIMTIGTSSRNVRYTYAGTPNVLGPNDTLDVSAQNIYLTQVGPFDLPTLISTEEYSVTFI